MSVSKLQPYHHFRVVNRFAHLFPWGPRVGAWSRGGISLDSDGKPSLPPRPVPPRKGYQDPPGSAPARPPHASAPACTPDRLLPHCRSTETPGSGSLRSPQCGVRSSAGLGHPVFTAKALECRRLPPYPVAASRSRTLSNMHAGNDPGSMAGKRLPGRIDQHQPASPTAHAGFGIARVVVGQLRSRSACARATVPRRRHTVRCDCSSCCRVGSSKSRLRSAQP